MSLVGVVGVKCVVEGSVVGAGFVGWWYSVGVVYVDVNVCGVVRDKVPVRLFVHSAPCSASTVFVAKQSWVTSRDQTGCPSLASSAGQSFDPRGRTNMATSWRN